MSDPDAALRAADAMVRDRNRAARLAQMAEAQRLATERNKARAQAQAS